ncbi:hypothetical protein BURMUCF1_B0436 [Burkholderia multivorans ATCC BAA-247]|nr:hypothetical protein BURMUCF1_B0436 [Burkholderia multivorans ATCC BAA-247]
MSLRESMAFRIGCAITRDRFNCSASRITPLRHLDHTHLCRRFDTPMSTRHSTNPIIAHASTVSF